MKLWLDDIRPMPSGFDVHVKTVEEAVIRIASGTVRHISFDHDLGVDPYQSDPSEGPCDIQKFTGYDLAKYIEKAAHEGGLSRITWEVHSANPVGKKNIEASMSNADRYWSELEETIDLPPEGTISPFAEEEEDRGEQIGDGRP